MQFKIKTGDPSTLRSPCLVLGVHTKRCLSEAARVVDRTTDGYLGRMLKQNSMEGELGQTLLLHDVPAIQASRVLLVGLDKVKEFNAKAYRKALEAAVSALQENRIREVIWTLHQGAPKDTKLYSVLRDTLLAVREHSYRFEQMKSTAKPPKHPLRQLQLHLTEKSDQAGARKALAHAQAIADGMDLAKDLGNLPGNICTPSHLADQALALGEEYSRLKVKVLDEKEMGKLGMGALLAVSRGSRQPAKLIVMDYRGGAKGDKPVVLVGKGLTFDAGGISIKPGAAMDEMKYDMCGGASVIGTMLACCRMELPINLVGVVPSSENLPDGAANKPGDIITSMSGQTIEVLNTDAEGRLILCDALTYCERYEPDVVVDIATLTGACVIALGKHASGLFTQDDELANDLLVAGQSVNDRAWRMPLWDDYQELLDSNFADMANIGGRAGGAITAACFLSRYTKKMRWAHLDIAGTAWLSGAKKGSTGRPVPLLSQYLLQRSSWDE